MELQGGCGMCERNIRIKPHIFSVLDVIIYNKRWKNWSKHTLGGKQLLLIIN